MPDDHAPFDELLALYCATHYQARIPGGKRITLRVGATCTPLLHPFLNDADGFAFITAWNPLSQITPLQINRCKQRELLRELMHAGFRCLPAAGRIPGQDWREPSPLVIGVSLALLDQLARRFDQNAIVHGTKTGALRLRIYRTGWQDRRHAFANHVEFA